MSEPIVYMLPLSSTPCHSFPCGIPRGLSCWFIYFYSRVHGASWRILSCQAMTSLSRLRQSVFNLWDGRWRLTMWYSSKKSFIKPIPSRPHTHRGIQRRTKQRELNHSLLHPHFASLTHTDALVYHFIPKRLYTLKQTEETVIVRAQLSCTVHLLDCWGTKGPLLMRLAACEWEVRHPWPFPWLWTFNLPSTHPHGSDNTKQTPERERVGEKARR